MDVPRGHAMQPLSESDLYDFLFNYYKAEYAPIRSIWATATADPQQPQRWRDTGNEIMPLGFRPANAQAQKDLESLDGFIRARNLDAVFVRGIVVRYAKYDIHERLERKLFENCRVDLMVRKALKEKHLMDALWPSFLKHPTDLAQQGVKVRGRYGDMFSKYFRYLHTVDDFKLRKEVDDRIRKSTQLMLVQYVDHLTFGAIEPILPIQAKGAGLNRSQIASDASSTPSRAQADRFQIRFDAPTYLSETQTRSVLRSTECLKCRTKRDVTVVISIDPAPGPVRKEETSATKTPASNTPAQRDSSSRAAQKYSPGYVLPGMTTRPQDPSTSTTPPPPSEGQKQCPRCTFLNHASLVDCEMCGADLPSSPALPPRSPSPPPRSRPAHQPSASESSAQKEHPSKRPQPPNRQSLSSSIFSLLPSRSPFPFPQSQQAQPQPHPAPATTSLSSEPAEPATASNAQAHSTSKTPAHNPEPEMQQSRSRHESPARPERPLSRPSEMTMLPLSPPPRDLPRDMPESLLDSSVPQILSPKPDLEDDEGWGWGSTTEGERRGDEGEEEGGGTEGKRGDGGRDGEERVASPAIMEDLDAEARAAADVWGDD